MLAWLADELILRPTRGWADTRGKARQLVRFPGGQLELWSPPGRTYPPGQADVYVVKFGGMASRAERATEHPADVWRDLRVEVWAVNPPGYGGAPGRASLRTLARGAEAAYENVRFRSGDKPILLVGNSLGSACALHVASSGQVNGLILRNPPPLKQMLEGLGWWRGYFGADLIACQVPQELDAIAEARRCRAPAVFVSSQQDRLVAAKHQRRVYEAYGGEKKLLSLGNADHADPPSVEENLRYQEMLEWLRKSSLISTQTSSVALSSSARDPAKGSS